MEVSHLDQHERGYDSNPSQEFARRLYDDVLGWYKSADAKAQVILAIDGAFLAFLTGSIFIAPNDLGAILGGFTGWTWSLLGLMTISLTGSVASALYCLWSRIYSGSSLARFVAEAQRTNPSPDLYAPEVMWFFQMVAALDREKFRRTLALVDAEVELRALASQIHILSGNVRKKHVAVNVGFLLAAGTLVFFFAAGLSYLVAAV